MLRNQKRKEKKKREEKKEKVVMGTDRGWCGRQELRKRQLRPRQPWEGGIHCRTSNDRIFSPSGQECKRKQGEYV
jgi:hypothetical protein